MKIRKILSLVLASVLCLSIPLTALAQEPDTMTEIQAPQREIISIDEVIDTNLNVDFSDGNVVTYGENGNSPVQSSRVRQNQVSSEVINLGDLSEYSLDNLPEATNSFPQGIETAKVNDNLIPNEKTAPDEAAATDSIARGAEAKAAVNAAPIAALTPIILNMESLVDGMISTETLVAWVWDSYDPDGDDIEHYVSGIDGKYILGMLSGDIGFVTQFTDPGVYSLYYYCYDSNDTISNIVGFDIEVISFNQDEYFMGQLVTPLAYTEYCTISNQSQLNTALNNTFKYATGTSSPTVPQVFGVDVPSTKSILSVIQNTGNGSLTVKVYDSNENLIGSVVTKDNSDAQIIHTQNELVLNGHEAGRYYFVVTGSASQYRFLVGDEQNFEYYRYGYANRTQIALYKDYVFGGGASASDTMNYVSGYPTQRLVEEYYEFTANGTTTFTFTTAGTFMRFALYDPQAGGFVYDTDPTYDPNALRTQWGRQDRTYKAKLGTTSGKKYVVVIYNTNPLFGAYKARNSNQYIWNLYVGEPFGAMSNVNAVSLSDVRGNINVTGNTSNQAQFFLNYTTGLPNTAVLRYATMSLGGTIKLTNDSLYNHNFPAVTYRSLVGTLSSVWFEETKLSHYNKTPIYGNWIWTFKPSSSGVASPSMNIQYCYEIGD